MKFDNLKNKTVFDFTNDETVLKKLFPEYSENNKTNIIEMLKVDSTANGFYLWSFAELSGNNALKRAIEQQFDMNDIYGFDPE